GMLYWDSKRGCNIRAVTDGNMMPFEHWASTQPKIGQLFGTQHFMSLQAKTREDDEVSISRMFPSGYSVSTKHEPVFWDIGNQHLRSPVVIVEDQGGGNAKIVSMLLRSRLKGVWVGESVTKNDNEHFGFTKSDRDWTVYQCNFGTVAAQ